VQEKPPTPSSGSGHGEHMATTFFVAKRALLLDGLAQAGESTAQSSLVLVNLFTGSQGLLPAQLVHRLHQWRGMHFLACMHASQKVRSCPPLPYSASRTRPVTSVVLSIVALCRKNEGEAPVQQRGGEGSRLPGGDE
jgi:hypothetical protein